MEEVPQITPEHGVETDGGLVEHEQIRAVQDRRAERDARSLPAGQAGHDLVALRAELDEVDDLIDPARVDSEDPPEVAKVLEHREIAVDGRLLRHVPDARSAAPCGLQAGRVPTPRRQLTI